MRRLLQVLTLAALLVFAPPAGAQSDAEKQLAKKHYELGEQFYKISNYPRALVEFSSAYKLYPLPGLLFNIARCHEVMANLEKARDHYKLYLKRMPRSPKYSLVELRIKTLEQRLAAREAKRTPKPKPPLPAPVKPDDPGVPASVPAAPKPDEPTSPVVAPVTPVDEPTAPWGWKRTAGWTAVGVGGAALVAGVVLGAMASGKAAEYEDNKDTYFWDDLEELRESGESLEAGQIALLVAGGVIAAAGAGLLLWDHFSTARRRRARRCWRRI